MHKSLFPSSGRQEQTSASTQPHRLHVATAYTRSADLFSPPQPAHERLLSTTTQRAQRARGRVEYIFVSDAKDLLRVRCNRGSDSLKEQRQAENRSRLLPSAIPSHQNR